MAEMKTLNGFEIVDAKAREDISALQEAVENMPEGGGSSKTQINIEATDSPERLALLAEAYSWGVEGNSILDKYDITYVRDGIPYSSTKIISATPDVGSKMLVMTFIDEDFHRRILMWSQNSNKLEFGENAQILTEFNYSSYISGGGSDWVFTTDTYDSNLYNASEVFIMIRCSSGEMNVFSHVMFYPNDSDSYLGQNQYKRFAFTTPAGMDNQTPYWTYDGNCIDFWYCDGGYDFCFIAYKS